MIIGEVGRQVSVCSHYWVSRQTSERMFTLLGKSTDKRAHASASKCNLSFTFAKWLILLGNWDETYVFGIA